MIPVGFTEGPKTDSTRDWAIALRSISTCASKTVKFWCLVLYVCCAFSVCCQVSEPIMHGVEVSSAFLQEAGRQVWLTYIDKHHKHM